ncbi:MAG: L-threonylcarbamoyladenylate synthase [Chloroflexota bacterium]|nr:L-threonylcarbamoyladenylate synthase [Chloroflexota bacterium]
MVAERLLPDAAGIQRAAELLAAGEIVALPTDTVYGVACRWDDDAVLGRIFDLKRRPPDRRVPVLVRGVEDVRDLDLVLDDQATCLARMFWPGPLTLVLGARGESGESLGVRAPDHPVALALLRLSGPLRVTSANVSGQPEALTADEVLRAFATSDLLAAVVDGGAAPGGRASTVVDLTARPPRVAREGPIGRDDLARCIAPVVSEAG